MPEICTFYGIRITINCEKNAPHHKAHFHASYGGFEAVYSTEGELLALAALLLFVKRHCSTCVAQVIKGMMI